MTMSSTSVVTSPVAVTNDASGAARLRLLMLEAIVETTIDLEFGDRAEADAHADGRNAHQIAVEPRHRIVLVVREVEPAFEEDPARANRLGILGQQRTLLREAGEPATAPDKARADDKARARKRDTNTPHQNCLLLSSSSVTGPSFTSDTCIMA